MNKFYMVLDCETATLPYASTVEDEKARKNIAITKPLIYDLGWQIIDESGKVYSRKNYLISEIFSVPEIFDTAYYASKRSLYLDRLENNEITLCSWRDASKEMRADMDKCDAVGAYNAMFDFKKAIPFTDLYVRSLYSADFYDWMRFQNECCAEIAANTRRAKKGDKTFDPEVFRFKGKQYPLFDLWGLSCKHILDCDEYRANGWLSESGKYFSSTAESAYRFLTGEEDFDESHTAVDDAEIESKIFTEVMKKTGDSFEMGIIYFPFRMIGKVADYSL